MCYPAFMPIVRITFPETGSVYSGASAGDALRKLGKAQWDPESKANIKRALAWRYFVTTGGADLSIHEFMNDDEFIDALHTAGFFKVERIDQ